MTEDEFARKYYRRAYQIAAAFAWRFHDWIPKDDLAQLAIMAALAYFRQHGDADAVLIASVMRRQLIDALRNETRRGKRERHASITPEIIEWATGDRYPEAALIRRTDLARVISITSGRDRRILEGALQGETNDEIGRALAVNRSRVSQIRGEVLARLAARFQRKAA